MVVGCCIGQEHLLNIIAYSFYFEGLVLCSCLIFHFNRFDSMGVCNKSILSPSASAEVRNTFSAAAFSVYVIMNRYGDHGA